MGWNKREVLFIVVLLALIVFATLGEYGAREQFRNVCKRKGGVVVWDGRQYQCLKEEEPWLES